MTQIGRRDQTWVDILTKYMLEPKNYNQINFILFQMKLNGEREETSQYEENKLLGIF